MSGMKLWSRLVISALFSALPVMAQTKPHVFYNVAVFDGYHILRGRTVTVKDGMIQWASLCFQSTGLRAMSSCAPPTRPSTRPKHRGVIASWLQSPYM